LQTLNAKCVELCPRRQTDVISPLVTGSAVACDTGGVLNLFGLCAPNGATYGALQPNPDGSCVAGTAQNYQGADPRPF